MQEKKEEEEEDAEGKEWMMKEIDRLDERVEGKQFETIKDLFIQVE
jgi:hypothetical protein